MQCQACNADNSDTNRFCAQCGAAMTEPTRPGLPPVLGAGRYRTLRLLGEGARKRVYLATDERLGREVAVAVVKTEGLDAGGRLRISREAQAMARLGDDPHVVTVFDVGEEADGTPFIVSQYMPGGSLAEHLDEVPNRRLPLSRALEFGTQIAAGLAHAHRLGIVHRDLKPANVWLGADGRARLGDFGLAATAGASRITSEGMLLGTVAYLAPEQALGRDPDPKADLYALGAVLYELLCGRPPFLGDDAVSVIGQHLNSAPVTPSAHRDDVSPAVDALVLRLLEKDPASRPQDAADVVSALSDALAATDAPVNAGPTPAATARPLSGVADWGRFVGRADEMAAMRTAFDEAGAGRTRIVMVVGEPGIGKTRTVEELSVYASLRGAQVVWGHSYEGEIGVSFLPFVEAIRALVRDLSADVALLDPSAGCAEVATIVPELRDRLPGLAVLPLLDGDAERHRLFEGVSTFLEAVTVTRPLVLVLDDLHWADKPSLLLLAHLARRVRRSRLLLIGTYRDVELERSHPLAETISTLRRERLYERVLLRGLPPDDVKAFIEAVGGQETPGEFASLIFRETEGNPFFVAEILRHLVETGAIRKEGGSWIGTPDSVAQNLPEGVREVIGRRLDGLSQECNAALAVAAAMPGGFDIDVVGDVAGVDEDAMLDLLDEALGAHVVRERRDRTGTYEFSHALIRQTLYGELSTPRRIRMHRKVTEALERRYADSIDSHLPELAFHAFQAAPGGDIARAVRYARRAGDRAMHQTAFEEAARSYDMAIQALDLSSETDLAERVDLRIAQAEAHDRAGEIDACRAAATEAAEVARTLGDPALLGRAAVAYVGSHWYATAAPDPKRDRLLAEAAKALEPSASDPERAALLASVLTRHAAGIAFRDLEAYRPLADRAVSHARTSGQPAVLALALQAFSMRRMDDKERAELLREIVDLAEAGDDRFTMQTTRASLAVAAISKHDIGQLSGAVDSYAAEAERSREPSQRVNALQMRGMLATIQGRFPEAEALIAESALLARQIRAFDLFASAGVTLSTVYREVGRLAELEDATRRVVERNPEVSSWRAGLAQLFLEIGKPTEAARELRTVLDGGVPADVLRQYTLAMLAEVSVGLGDLDLVRRVGAQMTEDFDGSEAATLIGANAYHGCRCRYAALVAGALGEFDRSIALHERALAVHSAFQAPAWVARSHFELGRALVTRGGPGDQERAAVELTKAVDGANRLGAKPLLDRALAAKLELQGVASGTSVSASIDAVSAHVVASRPPISLHAAADGQITICFSDIVGYTSMTDRLGDDRTHAILRSHNELLRAALAARGGLEVKSEGDGFMLAFRRPHDALTFARDFQRRLAGHAWPPDIGEVRVRMGVHCGQVIRDSDDFFGRTVIVGARVAAQAGPGEVLVTEQVCRAVGSEFAFGPQRSLTLKGLRDPHDVAPLDF